MTNLVPCRHCGYSIVFEIPKAPLLPRWEHTTYQPERPTQPPCDNPQPESRVREVPDRVTADDVTGIDEIVLTGVDVHIEAMSDKSFTLIFTKPGGEWLQADLWSARKPVTLKLHELTGFDGVEIDPEAWK